MLSGYFLDRYQGVSGSDKRKIFLNNSTSNAIYHNNTSDRSDVNSPFSALSSASTDQNVKIRPLASDSLELGLMSDVDTDDERVVRQEYLFTTLTCLCPSLLLAVMGSVMGYVSSLRETNIDLTLVRAQTLFLRSFFALYCRKKLIASSILLHVLMATGLGWVMGPSTLAVYNITSFFAISTLILYFANIQLIYFTFTNHQVKILLSMTCLLSFNGVSIFCVSCFECIVCADLMKGVFERAFSRIVFDVSVLVGVTVANVPIASDQRVVIRSHHLRHVGNG